MVKLKSSTLIEVLIAMVILLCVFGAGMLLFSNLDRSSGTNLESRVVSAQLRTLAGDYQQGAAQDTEIQIDSILYYIEEQPLEGIQDRIKVKIFAERMLDNKLIDSIVRIQPISPIPKI